MEMTRNEKQFVDDARKEGIAYPTSWLIKFYREWNKTTEELKEVIKC